MKQASNKSNQQQASKSNDTPIGAMSVVEILKEISEIRDKKSVFWKLNNYIPKAKNYFNLSISNQNNLYKLLSENFVKLEIYVNDIINALNKTAKNSKQSLFDKATSRLLLGKNQPQVNINQENSDISKDLNSTNIESLLDTQNYILSGIADNIVVIVKKLKSGNINKKKDKNDDATIVTNANIIEVLEKLKTIVDDKKFLKNINKLLTDYKSFIDDSNTKKLMIVSLQLSRFTYVLSALGFAMQKTKKIFRSLTMTILMLALAVITPPFSIAMGLLFWMITKLQATFNPIFAMGFTKSVNSIRNVFIALIASMLLMKQVDTVTFLKIIGLFILLAGVLKLFTGSKSQGGGKLKITNKINTSHHNQSPLAGLFGLTFGLSILILVLATTKSINWQGAIAVVVFIGLIVTTLLFANKKKWGKSDIFSGLFKLSIGLAILLLCVDAVQEINWKGALIICTFIIAIGGAIFLSNILSKRGSGKFGGGLFGFAMGLAILLLCVDAVQEINWKGAFYIITFITLLSLALAAPSLISKGTNSQPIGGMLGFAFGVAILILCVDAANELNFIGILNVIGIIFLTGLAFAFIRNLGIGPKTIKYYALTIVATLTAITGIIWLAQKFIKPEAKTPIIYILGTLVLTTLSLYFVSKFGKQIKLSQILVPLIVAILYELIKPNTDISKLNMNLKTIELFTIASIILIGFALVLAYIMDKYPKLEEKLSKASAVVAAIGAGAAGMSVAVTQISNLGPISIEQILTFTIVSLILTGLTLFISKLDDKKMQKASIIMGIISAASILLGKALAEISNTKLEYQAALTFALMTLAFVGIAYILGSTTTITLIGVATLLVLAVGILFVGLSYNMLCEIPINYALLYDFVKFTAILAIGLALITVPLVLALVSAGLLIVIGLGSLLVASTLFLISIMPINYDNINNFINSTKTLAIGLSSILFDALKAVPTAIALVPVVILSLLIAGLFFLLNFIEINESKIENFSSCIKYLVKGFDKIGVVQAGKTALKAIALLPVAVTAYLLCIVFNKISDIEIDKKKMTEFGEILDLFVDNMSAAVDRNKEKLKGAKEGIENIGLMANAAKNMVDVIQALADLKIGKWKKDSKTGELKLSEYEQFDPDKHGLMVKKSMGLMLETLLIPLGIISSDDAEWDFGTGKKIPNPFAEKGFFGNDNMSGINRIKAIGDAFEKIPAIMQGFCNNPLLTDVSEEGSLKMQKLQENIGIFFDTIIMCMNKLPQKSVLDNWFDGTANWLKNTVQPVFETATAIVKKITPTKEGTAMWEYSKTPKCLQGVANFWSTTSLILNDVEIASKKKFNDKFAPKVIQFYNALEELNTNSWLNLTNMDSSVKIASSTKTLVNTLADSKSFTTINTNLEKTNKNIQAIVGNINKIQMPKAQILEKNLKLLTDAKSVDQLKEVIEHLKEMIGMLKEVQEEQVKATQAQTEQAQQQFDEEKQYNANKELSDSDKQAKLLTVLEKLQLMMEGTGIHAEVNLDGVSDEIVQALEICGVGNGAKSSGWKGYGQYR